MESFDDRRRKFDRDFDDTARWAKGTMVFAMVMLGLIVFTCVGVVIVGLVWAL